MVAALILVTALSLNQWRMHRARTRHAGPSSKAETERAEPRPHPLETQLHEAGSQLEIAQCLN